MIIPESRHLWAAWTADGDPFTARVIAWKAYDEERPELAPVVHGHGWDAAVPIDSGAAFTLHTDEAAAKDATHRATLRLAPGHVA